MAKKLTFIPDRGLLRIPTKALNPEKTNTEEIRIVSHFCHISTKFIFLFGFVILFFTDKLLGAGIDELRQAVVQIRVYQQAKDSYSPWVRGPVSASSGSGFLISGNRILTNAHVVSQAKFLEGQRGNQSDWFELEIEAIAHDCDLAILKAKKKDFYTGANPLELATQLPELGSPVQVIGYPIGGSKVSISRGVVSRIEQSVYAHSQVDSHLVIQVDAAINPGNSGGPAIQDGQVIGVAFQAATKGENIGYIIPIPVVERFLKDLEDGIYDGYVELGIRFHNSYSTSEREFFGIPLDLSGVYVRSILPESSASGFLELNDFLLSIDGYTIANNGTVTYDDKNRVEFVELVDQKFQDDPIVFILLRKGKKMEVRFPAKKLISMEYHRNQYGKDFESVVIGGLVFQALNRDLLESWGKVGQTQGGSLFLYHFQNQMESYESKKEILVLYRKLSHPINQAHDYYLNQILESVNGKKISNLRELKDEIASNKSNYLVLRFLNLPLPLVFSTKELLTAEPEIIKSYKLSP